MKKSKQELIDETKALSLAYSQKKEAIEKIFSDLDKEKTTSNKHLSGIAAVNEIMKEMKELEEKHAKILEEIKGS
jgi:hypothetical protein